MDVLAIVEGWPVGDAMASGFAKSQSFTDADAYAGFIPLTQVQLVIARPGQLEAKATLITLDNLWMQRFSDNLPRVAQTAAKAGRVIVSFRTSPGPSLMWDGLEMTSETVLRHTEAFDSFQRPSGDAAWGSVSVPVTTIADIGSVIAGGDAIIIGNAAASVDTCTNRPNGDIHA